MRHTTRAISTLLSLKSVAAAACLSVASASNAAVYSLWATSVPETSSPASTAPWTNEGYAAGAPPCYDCNNSACQYATNSVSGNTTPLAALDFQAFTLSSCERIVSVRFEVTCRYNSGTVAGIDFRATAPNFGIDSGWRASANFSNNNNCSDRLGSTGDITSIHSSWTEEKINNLRLQVRRKSTVGSNTLRVVGMRLIVTTAPVELPAAPTNFRTTGRTSSSIGLAWSDNANNETHYEIWRYAGGNMSSTPVVVQLPANSTSYTDTGLAPSTQHVYVVVAGTPCEENEAWASVEASTVSAHLWINEISLQNANDMLEFVGPAGTLGGNYTVAIYTQVPGTGTGRLYQAQSVGSLIYRNGAYDLGVAYIGQLPVQAVGIALIHNPTMEVVEFLSHDCTMLAVDGPAMGRTSVRLPYSLTGQPSFRSLSRQGYGCTASSFTWSPLGDPNSASSLTSVNHGQTLGPVQ